MPLVSLNSSFKSFNSLVLLLAISYMTFDNFESLKTFLSEPLGVVAITYQGSATTLHLARCGYNTPAFSLRHSRRSYPWTRRGRSSRNCPGSRQAYVHWRVSRTLFFSFKDSEDLLRVYVQGSCAWKYQLNSPGRSREDSTKWVPLTWQLAIDYCNVF